jgi:hypothetical protein
VSMAIPPRPTHPRAARLHSSGGPRHASPRAPGPEPSDGVIPARPYARMFRIARRTD